MLIVEFSSSVWSPILRFRCSFSFVILEISRELRLSLSWIFCSSISFFLDLFWRCGSSLSSRESSSFSLSSWTFALLSLCACLTGVRGVSCLLRFWGESVGLSISKISNPLLLLSIMPIIMILAYFWNYDFDKYDHWLGQSYHHKYQSD